MTWFRVDPNAERAPSAQIVDALLDGIAAGRFDQDPKLPSVRSLAVAVLVNPNTVSKAYLELERLGVTRSRSGSGVFVIDEGREIARTMRRSTTRSIFDEAALAALRSGHDLESLTERLKELSRETEKPSPQAAIEDSWDQPMAAMKKKGGQR
ncbi:MAG: GntR family transcriptional regulator [Planctomycetota bacterium]